MFENDDNRIETRVIRDDHPVDRLPLSDAAKQSVKRDGATGIDMDGEEAQQIHSNLLGHYYRELDRQTDQRLEMEMDEAFYDHIQWTAEEIEVLEDRGQVPITYNIISTAVNWILGTQRRSPTDYKVLPRTKEGLKHAQRKTELMKYISDVNYSQMHVARAFADQVKAGIGWLETGAQANEEGEPVYERWESWRNLIWDSTSIEMDFSDGRYIFRTKWADTDTTQAIFPRRAGIIRNAAEQVFESGSMALDTSGDDPMDSAEIAQYQTTGYSHVNPGYSNRERVRLFEAWFRKVQNVRVVDGGDFSGEIFDEYSEGHVAQINEGRATLVNKPRMRMMVAIFTTSGLLYIGNSPYRHNRFPFTPMWGNRRASDNMPYGLIRGLRDIQRDINKRASKALHILNAKRTYVEEGAVDDIDGLREEIARPDALIISKPGKTPPKTEDDLHMAAAQLEYMSRDIAMIQQTSGVTDENMGRETNATSGKAILARQSQGALATSLFFDNLTFARRVHGEKVLCNIEQFYTKAKTFRIVDDRGNPQYVAINDETPEDNWITRTKADFVISEQDANDTQRQANVAALLDLVARLAPTAPQLVLNILDLIIEMMDLPKGSEIVKRTRQITGVTDPDADPNNPDPETIAIAQQKQAQMAQQKRLEDAKIAETEGKAQEALAKARKVAAEAIRTEASITADQMEVLKSAIDGAVQVLGQRGAAVVAGALIKEAEQRAASAAMPPQDMSAQPQAPQDDAPALPAPQPEMADGSQA